MDDGLTTQLGRRLGAIVRGDVSPAAREAARSRLFHALGVTLRSSQLPPSAVAWQAVQPTSGSCVVIGRSGTAAPDDAAFVNGVVGHSSLQEDCGPGGLRSGSHPGTYVIPAVLAAAEEQGASGERLLLGLIAGYEAVGRIGAIAPPEIVTRKFRPLAMMGPFGAAAGVAAVQECTDEHIASALAVAATMAGGSTQGIYDGTIEPYLQAGLAARSGLMAVRLAAAGARTSLRSLEGDFGFFQAYGGTAASAGTIDGDRDDFAICTLGTKPYAACLQNQLTIGLILRGVPGGLPAERIGRVTVRRPRRGTNGLDSPGVSRQAPFDNMLAAQMSARFTAAAALLNHGVDDPAYYHASFADPTVTALAARIDLVSTEDDSVTVEVELCDGAPIVLDSTRPSSALPDLLFPSATRIRDGFLRRARPLLRENTDRVATLIDRLQELEDVRLLTGLLR
jgi:2-methylcitrate dehydratase PrpD